jgi:hypothetical protein
MQDERKAVCGLSVAGCLLGVGGRVRSVRRCSRVAAVEQRGPCEDGGVDCEYVRVVVHASSATQSSALVPDLDAELARGSMRTAAGSRPTGGSRVPA